MLKTTTAGIIALSMISTTATAEVSAGFAPLMLDAPHHGRQIEMALWYPAETTDAVFNLFENGVFYGTPVIQDAQIINGSYPVVLMSHGLGGNFYTLGWLAAGLAKRGAIVVSVNHPNSTTRDFDIRAGLDHWTRAEDLSVALDYILVAPEYRDFINPERIMAAGFSYGGWTALSLGGLTGDLAGYVSHCAGSGDRSSHCNDISRAGVDLTDVSAKEWNASYRDPRVTHVAAIDPGLMYGLSAENVTGLVADVLLIGLGAGDDRLYATDFTTAGNGFETLLPSAETVAIAPANHFSALLTCKPDGAAILKSENDDPVCDDPTGGDRDDIHAQIIDAIAKQLGL